MKRHPHELLHYFSLLLISWPNEMKWNEQERLEIEMKWNEMKWFSIFHQSFVNEIDEISWNFMRFHEEKKGPQMKCKGLINRETAYQEDLIVGELEQVWGSASVTVLLIYWNSRLLFLVRLSFTTSNCDLSLLDTSNMLVLFHMTPLDFPRGVLSTVEFSPTHCPPTDLDFSLTDFPPASSE